MVVVKNMTKKQHNSLNQAEKIVLEFRLGRGSLGGEIGLAKLNLILAYMQKKVWLVVFLLYLI